MIEAVILQAVLIFINAIFAKCGDHSDLHE